ncbi:CPBP family intramembrane glutamic endopeptidase [Streptococcus respiraculi]|uniref:CPBP family intramembrane glutamic endopeptidase n=1 Tax=Streptococcus respiraculi TaxID=2021971 RepID=UPI000E73166A|nr:type II CAAX endopeptidase family protein [Streptococcus respiraculi]
MERKKSLVLAFVVLYTVMFWTRWTHWLVSETFKGPIVFTAYTVLCFIGICAYWDSFVEKARWLKKHPLKALGIVLLSLLFFFVATLLFSMIEDVLRQFVHVRAELSNDTGIYAAVKQYPAFLILGVMGVLGPIVEELIYRQFLLDFLPGYMSKSLAVLISSVLFAVLHVHHLQLAEFISVIGHFGYGLVFALIYLKTNKNIYFPISLHVLNNLMGLLAIVQNI